MNPGHFLPALLPALLAASLANAQPAAPDAAPAKADNPPAAAAEAKTEMQKWIEATDAQWQAAFKRDVTDVREADAKKLMLQYLNLLEEGIKKASSASNLDGAVALRAEQKRFSDTQLFPEQDEAAEAASVKQMRVVIRTQLAKLDKDSAVRAKALHARYDQVLAQAQTQLTQAQRLDDALLVKAKREEVTAAWLTPAAAALAENATPSATVPATRATNVPKPATPKVPFGMGGMAKVDAPGLAIAPLVKDEKLWIDRDVRLGNIPAKFKDCKFTQANAHGFKLHFKVLTDGLVYMGCTTRWGSTATPAMAKDFATAETLKKNGWTQVPDVEIPTTGDIAWTFFSRTCKSGEEFTYQTDKYAPPILLVK